MPPVQGKAALAKIKMLVASDYFPLDIKGAEVHLRNSTLGNGGDSLFKVVVDDLIFGFVTANDPLHHKAQVYMALNALIEMRPVVVVERLRKNLNVVVVNAPDKDFSSAAALIAWVKGAFDVLGAPARDKIKRYVEVGPVNALINQLEAFYFIPFFTSVVIDRINGLTVDELAPGVATNLKWAAKQRSIGLLGGHEAGALLMMFLIG
jgi:hypothetical protein